MRHHPAVEIDDIEGLRLRRHSEPQARDLLSGDRRYEAASQLDLGMLDAEEGHLEKAETQMLHGLIRLRDLDARVQMVRALAT